MKSHPSRQRFLLTTSWIFLFQLNVLIGTSAASEHLIPNKVISPDIVQKLQTNNYADIIILFEDGSIESEVISMRKKRNVRHDDDTILSLRARRYREQKLPVFSTITPQDAEIIDEYTHLPMAALKIHSLQTLALISANTNIAAIYPNLPAYPYLAQSLPLIGQPTAQFLGLSGMDTSIAIIDSGANWDNGVFGNCTSPGYPETCKIAAVNEIAPDDGSSKDSSGHGTNVAAIALGVAPTARVVALDVTNPDGTSMTSLIISAINWAIANKNTYNIVSLNISMGDGNKYNAPCSNKRTNPYLILIANARAAGILPVASSGNENYTDGIANPACTPGIVSVGAAYDAELGARSWSTCTDSSTMADRIICFSNSASFLTMLAPGAITTAAGFSYGGTSQAAPHVAGAIAVLRSAWPEETLEQTENRLITGGKPLLDQRNGLTFPRLSLTGAMLLPPQDLFANAAELIGESGYDSVDNIGATKEPYEPDHAGARGGDSLWWRWIAPSTSLYSMDTHGSSFDTVLAVYQGTEVEALFEIIDNDNDGSLGGASGLSFMTVEGQEYRIAVDSKDGAAGTISLHWGTSQEDADIPMLPPWGVTMLGGIISAVAILYRKHT